MVKRPLSFVVALLIAVLALTPSALIAVELQRPMKAMERASGVFDRAEHLREMEALQQQLSRSRVDLPEAVVLEVVVTAEERRAVRQANVRERKLRVGVVKQLSVPMDFSRELVLSSRAQAHGVFGAVRGEGGGGFTWSGVVRTPQAEAVRVHFTDFDLPAGAELYVYSRDGMAFGPYTGRGPNGDGEFWSNTVTGPEIVIQLDAGRIDNPTFTIAGVGHMTPEFGLAASLAPQPQAANTKPCSYNADCVEDAACTTLDNTPRMTSARKAVASILFASGAFLYICSGGLVADSDPNTEIPYFITANHCISKGGEANSMETFFFYENTACGSCTAKGAKATTGSSIVSTNRTSDYTLLRLSQPAPTGALFLGWNANPVANTHGAGLYRLSHPKGAPQAYSEHAVDTNRPTCRSWPRGDWIYSSDTFGATEGGSSGSPVVNAAGELVGQLSGACGYNVNDVCDTASNATVDGAFAAYYSSVAQWLGPGDGGDPGDPDPPPAGISLSVTTYKVRGDKYADLLWSGAKSTSVDLYRNGTKFATTANDGSETDGPNGKGGGSVTYKVCEAGTSTCSNDVTASY
jgi:V8-like Glu-specific endopeptidase